MKNWCQSFWQFPASSGINDALYQPKVGNFEVAKGLTGNIFVISNPTEGQYKKFREFKDLNYTCWNNLGIFKTSYKSELHNFLLVLMIKLKYLPQLFPMGRMTPFGKKCLKRCLNKRKNTVRKIGSSNNHCFKNSFEHSLL